MYIFLEGLTFGFWIWNGDGDLYGLEGDGCIISELLLLHSLRSFVAAASRRRLWLLGAVGEVIRNGRLVGKEI